MYQDSATLEALGQTANTISLWYHKKGNAVGELRVEARGAGAGAWNVAWSRSGEQGDAWYTAAGIRLQGPQLGNGREELHVSEYKFPRVRQEMGCQISWLRSQLTWHYISSPRARELVLGNV